jgi:N-acetylglutamate synthase-like GNAT family acetyltransferase
MTEHFHIQPANENDLQHLTALVNSAYRGESSKQGWTTEADLLDGQRTDEAELGKQLQGEGNTILKYTDANNNILACVYLHKKDTAMYLGMLTVAPTLQANGIGKQLLAAAEQFAAGQGCQTVEMTVISVRQELIAWYNRRGYYATGETKPFPVDVKFGVAKQHLEFIVMEKKL